MKKRNLQMKWTKRIVLIGLLFGVAGLGKMYAQNLIVNSDFESGNTGFITDYSYTATGVVGEGYYCIDVTAQGHDGGTLGGWPNIPGFGGSGKYMLVNGHGGATNPTKIVWKQTVNVTANTDYLFSCQVVNLAQSFFGYSPNPAKLRLKINGSNVGADLTIAQNNEWHPWSNTWSSGSATQATIEIYDVYTGNSGLGDDFGLDHFQLTPQATYSVNAVDDDASVCLYSTVQIDVLDNDIITPSGQQAGATVQIIQNPQHGTATWNNNTRKIQYMFIDASYSGDLDQFKYRVTIPHGEMSEAWVYVTTSKQPSVGWINPPATICAGAPLGIPTPTVEPAQGTGQWEYCQTQNGMYSPIPDPNNVPFSMNSNWVRYSVTNDCGESHSNSVLITVKDAPSIGTIQAPPAINAGGSFNLTQPAIQPNGSPIFNQGWQIAATQNGNYSPFNNNNVPYSYNGYWIRYFADNDCGVGYSNAVQITVYQNDNNITFADANVKAICVANWDTNGDGELSYVEAAAVTDLGQVFRGDTTITSFEELQYFTELTTIGDYAFENCSNLSGSLYIPNSVTEIGASAFRNCSGLIGNLTIPNSVTSIGVSAFSGCSGFTGGLTIPNSVTAISDAAFYGCGCLTSVIIGDSVTLISQSAFGDCRGLTSVIIGSSVTQIGNGAFYFCIGLTSITIPNSVTSIGSWAFGFCYALTSMFIPNSVTSIEAGLFYCCTSLGQIVVETGNAVYDSRENCNAIIETSTNELVAGCKNTIIPNTVTSIGNSAFEGCLGLTSLDIPNSVTSIGDFAFRYCHGLSSLAISNSLTSIGMYAFESCNDLISIVIPNSVTFIGDCAFRGCSGLTSMTVLSETPPTLGYDVFYDINSSIPVYVPCNSISAYQSVVGWNGFANYIEMCPGMITVVASPAEGGTITGGGLYEGGATCTLTTTPNEGFLFMNWTRNGEVVSNDSSYSFIVTGDADYVANFAEEGDVCALTFDLFDSYGDGYTGNYLVVTDGNGISQRLTIESGSSAVYTIPILNGSRLALTWILGSWTEDCSFTVSYSNGNVIYHGENLNEGFSYEFDVDCVGMPVSTFDVMAVANPIDGGTITGTGQYEYNATCTLTAIANEGYTFTNWTENGAIVSNDAEYSFIVSEDRDLVANFVEGDLCAIIFDLFDSYGDGYTGNHLVVTDENGSQQLTVESGSSAVYTLPFLTGSHITLTWIVGSYPEDCSFTVSYSNGNVIYHGESLNESFSYEFDVDCDGIFDIMAEAIPMEGGEVYGAGQYEYNATCTLTAIANEGYTFVNWTQDGTIISNEAEYSFYVVGNMELVARFAPLGNIIFADDNVKAICIAYWDTNEDGELSYAEAAAVTDLGQVFRENTEITSFEELQYFTGLTTISSYAFFNCSNLSGSLYIPNSVTTIGNDAFYGCSGFSGSLTIPNSVTTINGSAFRNCSGFTGSLTIPNSVTTIGYYAFYGCSKFDSIVVESGNTVYDSRESCNALIKTSTNELILGCKNSIIPNSVTTIGNCAFYYCTGLTGSLTIPNSVTSIGNEAFSGCSGFTGSLTLGNSMTTIGGFAFSGSSFTGSLTIPNSVATIGYGAFYGCSGFTGSLTLSNSMTSIGSYAFSFCSGFTGSLTIPNSVTIIGDGAFQRCNGFVGNLVIPNSVTVIGHFVFSGCSGFTGSLTIPSSVTEIGDNAFQNCNGFTGSLTIPSSVTMIGERAFFGCSSLTEAMLYNSDPPSLGNDAFYIYNNSFPIYVPYESLNDYKTATNWSYYEDRIFPMAYTTISGYGEGEGNYRFIASPLVENTAPTAVDNMITETAYDLYRFDQSEDAEWINYKANTEDFVLQNGQGYLYANAEDVNLVFKGEFNEDDTKEVGLAYDATATFAGWNLVGNPFPVDAYANKSYYTMNEEGTAIEPVAVSMETAIPACTGVMVMAEAEGETVVFSTEAPEAATNQGCLQIELSQAVELVETPTRKQDGPSTGSGTLHDKAIVSFNAGDRLEKFVFNKENAVISIPQGGKELAIACSDKQGEMPLNFKASKNGEYTLTINPEAVELEYLHLIDNLTGADVDLLALRLAQGPANYTFEAKTTDYASRFRLVFNGKEADGPSTGSETFAFINNGNIIITGADAGATLQIVDMTGRVVASCGGHTRCVPTTGMAKGVYVLRLINGDDVKTQKIVIR